MRAVHRVVSRAVVLLNCSMPAIFDTARSAVCLALLLRCRCCSWLVLTVPRLLVPLQREPLPARECGAAAAPTGHRLVASGLY